jgi:hypothetical protein
MLQIILVIAVACVAAYFIATSRKSKVEEVSKDAPAPKNPTSDPVQPAPAPVEEVKPKAKIEPIASVQQVEELKEAKKVVKKKTAPKKKATK